MGRILFSWVPNVETVSHCGMVIAARSGAACGVQLLF